MSRTSRWVALASVLAWGCAENEAGDAGDQTAPNDVPGGAVHDARGLPVLATLHTKDSELTILGRGGEVRFSLLDADGERHDDLSLEDLQAYDPNLYEVVQHAMANANAGRAGAPFVDARLTPRPLGSVVKSLSASPAPPSR